MLGGGSTGIRTSGGGGPRKSLVEQYMGQLILEFG